MGTFAAGAASNGGSGSDWRQEAACRRCDPELFFPDRDTAAGRAQVAAAKEVCRRCPVTMTCLNWALASGQEAGIWGGTSEEQRRVLSRRLSASGRRAG